MKNLTITLLLGLIVMVDMASAQITNPKISIQGILREASGVAVEDGEYDLVFRIYEDIDAAVSTAIYEETHPQVTIANGIYSVHLGTHNSMGFLPFDKEYFVGVQVGSSELKPRIELTHSPYSMAARSVSCSGAVGDVKYSILDYAQFQLANGDCWVPMDGRTIPGTTALAQEFNITQVPDMSGLFMRAHEWNDGNDPARTPSSAVAVIQDDELKAHDHTGTTDVDGEHTHGINDPGHSHGIDLDDSSGGGGVDDAGESSEGSASTASSTTGISIKPGGAHSHSFTTDTYGGAETRPKNMNFYVYIRVN